MQQSVISATSYWQGVELRATEGLPTEECLPGAAGLKEPARVLKMFARPAANAR